MTQEELNKINEARLLIEKYEVDELRQCEECNIYMASGFIYQDGTYCSFHCLPISEKEWNEQYNEEGENYWTEWSEL